MNRLILTTLIVALAGACSSETDERAREAAVPAELERVSAVEISEDVEASGSVTAGLSADVAAKVMGTITTFHVSEGDRVRSGQALVEIDVRELQAQAARARGGLAEAESAIAGAEAAVAAAQAQRDLARATWERYRELLTRESVSRQEFDEVDTRLRAAEAGLTRAERGLDQARARRQQATAELGAAGAVAGFATLRAPFDGIVTRKHRDVGDQTAPGVPVVRIDADSRFRLDASVDATIAGRLAPGEAVTVVVDAIGGELQGTVQEVVPAIDAATRSALVKISLPAAPGLKTGMYGRARIPIGRRTAVLIPRDAVRRQGQLEQVWVVGAENESTLRFVRTGREFGDRVEILSGIAPDERIVVSSNAPLHEGSRIAPTGGRA